MVLGIVGLDDRGRADRVRRGALLALAAAAALALPAAAWAHAGLRADRAVGEQDGELAAARASLLTYTEPIEARFAIVSVTDASGTQVTSGPPQSAPGSPQTLIAPLRACQRAGISSSGA